MEFEINFVFITATVIALIYIAFLFLWIASRKRSSGNKETSNGQDLPVNATLLNANDYFTIEASATNCSAACGHGLGVFSSRDIANDSYFVVDKRLLSKLNDSTVPLPLSNTQTMTVTSLQDYVNLFQSSWINYQRVSAHQRNCEIFLTRDGRVILHTLRTVLAREEMLRTMDYEWLLSWHRQELKRIYDLYRENELDMKQVLDQVGSLFNQALVQMLLSYNQNEKDTNKIALYDHIVQDYASKVEQDVDGDEDFLQLFMMYIG